MIREHEPKRKESECQGCWETETGRVYPGTQNISWNQENKASCKIYWD